MSERMTSRLREFFNERASGELRSIIKYEQDGYDVVYLRDDVAARYTEDELASSVDDARMESLTAPIYEDAFASDHGGLICMVKCYDEVVEMNFVLDDGVGAAVGLGADAFDTGRDLVAEARRIVIEERERVRPAESDQEGAPIE